MNDEPKSVPPGHDPAWQAQRAALRRLHREVLDEPVPPELLATLAAAAGRHDQRDRWMRWGGMAAGIVIAFGAGWLANGQRGGLLPWAQSVAAPAWARALATQEFVHAAEVAHAVYVPEVRHPVEVTADEQQHLAQWLSKRLDRPLKVPDLSAQGYALVGGRLLPGADGARAQFMFERGSGERVTLYIGSLAESAAPGRSGETAFRFSSDGPVPSFYWIDHGFGYALAGQLPRAALLDLATGVYRQLE